MNRIVLALPLTLALVACSSVINSEAITYNDVIEEVTDKMLLANVLRARDRAPLHFGDIPLIHETVQVNAGLGASVAAGSIAKSSSAPLVLTPSLGLQVSPSFDVLNVDSKDFVTGIASPIESKYVTYWLDRGVPTEMAFELFFSKAEVDFSDVQKQIDAQHGDSGISITAANAPRPTPQDGELAGALCDEHGKCTPNEFLLYLHLINNEYGFTVRPYTVRRLLWAGDSLDKQSSVLKGIAALDPTKVQLSYTPKKGTTEKTTYKIYTVSADEKLAICPYKSSEQTPKPSSTTPSDDPCETSVITQTDGGGGAGQKPDDILMTRRAALLKFQQLIEHAQGLVAFDPPEINVDVPTGDPQNPTTLEKLGAPGQPDWFETLIGMMLGKEKEFRYDITRPGQNGKFSIDTYRYDSPQCDYNLRYNRVSLNLPGHLTGCGDPRLTDLWNIWDLTSELDATAVSAAIKSGVASAACTAPASDQFKKLATMKIDAARYDARAAQLKADAEDLQDEAARRAARAGQVTADAKALLNEAAKLDAEAAALNSAAARRNAEAAPINGDVAAIWLCGGMERQDWEMAIDFFSALQRNAKCFKSPGAQPECNADASSPKVLQYGFSNRSVGEMIQYLGDLVWYQDNFQSYLWRHSPVTLGVCGSGPWSSERNCTGGVLFQVLKGPDLPQARFTLSYRNAEYGVADFSGDDHSLQVMAIISQLVDLNKSATDLRPTPVVQVIP